MQLRTTKEQRVEIINNLITFISLRGRRFFSTPNGCECCNNDCRNVAEMVLVKGRIYFRDSYTKKMVYPREGRCWDGFSQGGTLRALILDFTDFIRTGHYSNHNHGYGGLYCPHWGYDEGAMKEIQEYAHEIGYLSAPKK